jgi:hypothetical protein
MANVETIQPNSVSGFSTDNIEWIHLEGGPNFDYPIDYWIALLGAQPEEGRVDFLVKWEPDSYCHYHRHVGHTTSIVLEGEHHIVDTCATETVHKTRTVGHYASSPAGDLHMEYGGPQGSVLFFSMHTPDGKLFDVLDRDENILATATIESLMSGKLT